MSGLWPPCFYLDRHKIFPALKVIGVNGGWLETETMRVFDASSSWWCKHLGHRHPEIIAAINTQTEQYIHAIGANTYSEAIENLSQKLTSLYPNLNKVSYASDGSCAVEMAIKMSLHTRKLLYPNDSRRKIIKLAGAYHGETSLALAVSDCDLYKGPYKEILIETYTCAVPSSCYGIDDPLWHDAEQLWLKTEAQLETIKAEAAILIIEPLLQAANCMNIYSADFLKRLLMWARDNKIDIVSDEIMTGFWRTGKYMAIDYISFEPDFICLGKGLTAGSLPMSAVLCANNRFDICSNDPFLHSHTYSTHALAAAAANAALEVYSKPETEDRVKALSGELKDCFIQLESNKLHNIRSLGCVVAADLKANAFKRIPSPAELQKTAAEFGVLIRPLGETIYLCPPINTSTEEVHFIQNALAKTLSRF